MQKQRRNTNVQTELNHFITVICTLFFNTKFISLYFVFSTRIESTCNCMFLDSSSGSSIEVQGVLTRNFISIRDVEKTFLKNDLCFCGTFWLLFSGCGRCIFGKKGFGKWRKTVTAIRIDVKDSVYFDIHTCIDVHRDKFTFLLCLGYICFNGSKQLTAFTNIELSVRDHTVWR